MLNPHEIEVAKLVIIGILMTTSLALVLILFLNFSQKRILAEKTRNQELEIKYQKELLASTILTQEEERKRIAKDLHDDIGSKLNVIHLNLHHLKKLREDTGEFEGMLTDINGLIDTTIKSTRRISHDLLPPTLENFGLVEAFKELCENFNSGSPNLIKFIVMHQDRKIKDKHTELHLFRIVQELINNSIKHAHPTLIELLLSLKKEQIELSYKDNGKGMNIDLIKEKKGLGLKNIDSRLNMLHAQVDYKSAPGEGFQVFIHTNYPENELN